MLFSRRFKSSVIDALLIAGLLLWLTIMVAAWFSVGRPGPEFKSENRIPDTATSETAQPQRPENSPEPPRPASNGEVADTSARHNPRNHAGAAASAKTPTAVPKPPEQPAIDASSSAGNPGRLSSKHVARALFASGVENNEPIDRVDSIFHSRGQAIRTLYYFTDLRGLAGETVTYHWRHDNRVIARVSFKVPANRYRAYSSKRLTRNMAGRWTVTLTDSAGETLSKASLVYQTP